MKKLSLPFLIVLFVAGALVHKGLAKKGSFTNPSLIQPETIIENTSSLKPSPKTIAGDNQTLFSIHKIVNATVYYELHLQKEATLETWKLSKGPSCNPLHQRRASKKEDSPIDYLLFEGTVLQGKTYKKGVLVWDYGTYVFQKNSTADCYELILQGKRIKGHYTLKKQYNDWILIKQEDQFADTHKNITRIFNRSALSGLTLTQILHGLKAE